MAALVAAEGDRSARAGGNACAGDVSRLRRSADRTPAPSARVRPACRSSIWAAIRFTQREVTTAVALVCGIAIWFTVNGRGPFGQWSTNVALLLLLAYTSTLVDHRPRAGRRDRASASGRWRSCATSSDGLAQRVDERTQRARGGQPGAPRSSSRSASRQEEVAAPERGALSAPRRRRQGLRDLHARSRRQRRELEHRRAAASRATPPPRSSARTFRTFYTPEDLARSWPEHELDGRARRGPLRGRRLARAQGRQPLLGERRHHARSTTTSGALRGFAKVTRDLTARRRIEALQETRAADERVPGDARATSCAIRWRPSSMRSS